MVATELLDSTRRIYAEDPDNDPYDDGGASTIGYTAAAIMELTYGFNIPVHVKWGYSKTDSFVPTRSQYARIALYIWGNRLFTAGNVAAKHAIAQQTTQCPNNMSPIIIDPNCKHTSMAAHFVEWELYTRTQPGHFYSRHIKGTRAYVAQRMVRA